MIFICGHYEGYDERIKTLVTDEISLGDFVLTGGELAAMTIVDATVRLIPNVLEKKRVTKMIRSHLVCSSSHNTLVLMTSEV